MTQPAFPAGMSELEFVAAYARAALRKPQVAADAALRSLFFSDLSERPVLAGLIAWELGDACRRLTAVYWALSDRRYSIARSLMKPLPGLLEWKQLVHEAATFTPEQIIRELSLGEDALPQAKKLRAEPSLADLNELVGLAELGDPMLLVPASSREMPDEVRVAVAEPEGETAMAAFTTDESSAAVLADLTATLCGIGQGFLESYLHARRTAGRRD